jgi:hypothetical protein
LVVILTFSDRTWRSHNDVRVGVLILEQFLVFFDIGTAIEYGSPYFGHVLAETLILVFDLECELAGMTEDQDIAFGRLGFYLLQRGEDKHSGLSQTGLGLAEDVGSQDGLRDADLLDCSLRISRVRRDDRQKANAVDEWSVQVWYAVMREILGLRAYRVLPRLPSLSVDPQCDISATLTCG